MTTPWERPETAVSSGLDPYSVTERSARRRTGDAGLGRAVVVPIYVRGSRPGRLEPYRAGLLSKLSPGGDVYVDRDLFPAHLGSPSAFWPEVLRASDDTNAVAARDGWSRVVVGRLGRDASIEWSLVLRSSDWALVRTALELRHRRTDPRDPQDAPAQRVGPRFLGRLDGMDGTTSEGQVGRLALEVVSHRLPGCLADATSLRWHAASWPGGLSVGAGERASGSGAHEMLLDLRQHHIRVDRRVYRVHTLPDWEREHAARDLGLSPQRLLGWPVAPLSAVLACFDDIAPAPLGDVGAPQDAAAPSASRGQQDRG